MPDGTQIIGVMRAHLEEMYAALDWARGYFGALDMADGYRQGKPMVRPSRSTALMEKAYAHAEGYLTAEEGE